jgi:hypothetical protein
VEVIVRAKARTYLQAKTSFRQNKLQAKTDFKRKQVFKRKQASSRNRLQAETGRELEAI